MFININIIIINNIKNTIKLNNKNTIKMVKIQQLPSGQLVITIPKRLAEYEQLTKGTEIEFKKHPEGFILEVKKR